MIEYENYGENEKDAITYLLRSLESINDPERYFTLVMGELLERFERICPLEIEKLLRMTNSCRFLLAVKPTLKDLDQHRILLPQTGEKEYPFYMLFMQIEGIGGRERINGILRQNLGTNYEENNIRLTESGLLVLRPDSFTVKGFTLELN